MIVYGFLACSSVSFRIAPVQLHVLINIFCYSHFNYFVLKTLGTVRCYVQLKCRKFKKDIINTSVFYPVYDRIFGVMSEIFVFINGTSVEPSALRCAHFDMITV